MGYWVLEIFERSCLSCPEEYIGMLIVTERQLKKIYEIANKYGAEISNNTIRKGDKEIVITKVKADKDKDVFEIIEQCLKD